MMEAKEYCPCGRDATREHVCPVTYANLCDELEECTESNKDVERALEGFSYSGSYGDGVRKLREELKKSDALVSELAGKYAAMEQRAELAEAKIREAEGQESQFDNEEAIEAAYWEMDARIKGHGEWRLNKQSERDAFKQVMRGFLANCHQYVNPEVFYLAEEAECVMKKLDEWSAPKEENGESLSLLGRILRAAPIATFHTVTIPHNPIHTADVAELERHVVEKSRKIGEMQRHIAELERALAEYQSIFPDTDGHFELNALLDKARDEAVPAVPPEQFREWVLRNLPDGTIIGSSEWWVSRLWAAATRALAAAPKPEVTND